MCYVLEFSLLVLLCSCHLFLFGVPCCFAIYLLVLLRVLELLASMFAYMNAMSDYIDFQQSDE